MGVYIILHYTNPVRGPIYDKYIPHRRHPDMPLSYSYVCRYRRLLIASDS